LKAYKRRGIDEIEARDRGIDEIEARDPEDKGHVSNAEEVRLHHKMGGSCAVVKEDDSGFYSDDECDEEAVGDGTKEERALKNSIPASVGHTPLVAASSFNNSDAGSNGGLKEDLKEVSNEESATREWERISLDGKRREEEVRRRQSEALIKSKNKIELKR